MKHFRQPEPFHVEKERQILRENVLALGAKPVCILISALIKWSLLDCWLAGDGFPLKSSV